MRFVLAAAAAAIVASAPAEAAEYVVNADFIFAEQPAIDADIGIGAMLDRPLSGLQVGDRVTLNMNFNYAVRLDRAPGREQPGTMLAGLEVFGNPPQNFLFLGPSTFSLGGATGDLITSGNSLTARPENQFFAALPVADPDTFQGGSFTSIQLIYDVVITTPRTIDRAFFATWPVPEPATWAMMIAGFGLAGGAIRSKRRVERVALDLPRG